ncbi:hypothetical protein C8J57DRAFT_1510876 [Mycena rebaudengoi]|nr:hypothetical protein C8J57DRAFT_1510876 [Mycena rebaudengoi]
MSVILLVSPDMIRGYRAWKAEWGYPLQRIVYQLAIMVTIAIGVGWVRHTVQLIGQWMADISKPIYARPPLPRRHPRPTPTHRNTRAPTALGNPGGIHMEMAGSTPPSAANPPRVVGGIPLSYMGRPIPMGTGWVWLDSGMVAPGYGDYAVRGRT